MYQYNYSIRVRYAETDKMGYVYYGNYATYFEVCRVETLRNLGLSYKTLEDSGVMLPVLEFGIKYFKPAFYDELLTIKTTIAQLPGVRIKFEYETFNEKGDLLNKAHTTLVFVDVSTGKPIAPPSDVLNLFKPHFTE